MEDDGVNQGVSLITGLQLAFILLKLFRVIHWSWWWVFSPMLGMIGLVALLLAVVVLCNFISGFIDGI